MENALIGIGRISAGSAYNIIAGSAEIEGSVRTFDPQVRAFVVEEIRKVAENVAASYGGEITFFNRDNTSPLINDEAATKQAQETAFSLFGKDNVITDRRAALGGDDMAEYILKVPGCYAYVGSGNKDIPETIRAHHDDKFDIDERALETAAEIYAAYTIDYLNGRFDKA